MSDLQKDVKSLRKLVETLVSQVDSQNNKERPKMANLLEEVNIVKETTNIQVSLPRPLLDVYTGRIIAASFVTEIL